MNLLLDTHAVLWWLADDPRLPNAARAALANPLNRLIASAAVGYEIVYKESRGRLSPLPEPLPYRLQREGVETLPISMMHAVAAAALPGPHRDPWDRIMIAQANIEALTVITIDRVFQNYGVPVLW